MPKESRSNSKAIVMGGGLLVGAVALGIHVHDKRRKRKAAAGVSIEGIVFEPNDTKDYISSTSRGVPKETPSSPYGNVGAQSSARSEPHAQAPRQSNTSPPSTAPYRSDDDEDNDVGPAQPTTQESLDPNKSFGYSGTTHLTYTEDGVPQRRTRVRNEDVPEASRSQAQWTAYHYDKGGQTEDMRRDLDELRGYRWWDEF